MLPKLRFSPGNNKCSTKQSLFLKSQNKNEMRIKLMEYSYVNSFLYGEQIDCFNIF